MKKIVFSDLYPKEKLIEVCVTNDMDQEAISRESGV